jgi:hypothetical protein
MMHFRQLEHVLESDLGVRVDANSRDRRRHTIGIASSGPFGPEDAAAPAHDSESAVHLRTNLPTSISAKRTAGGHQYKATPQLSIVRQAIDCRPPFASAGDKAQQDYFSDGVTEEIITELSRSLATCYRR